MSSSFRILLCTIFLDLDEDISEYYPSINEIVLNKVLIFAKYRVGLRTDEIEIIKLARISVLEYRNKLWIRKDSKMSLTYQSGHQTQFKLSIW